MNIPVFTYGTLLSEKVLNTVLGRVPERTDATLYDFIRHPICGQCFPAVVPSVGNQVNGKLLLQLSAAELVLLDAFEDPAYERCLPFVTLKSGQTARARVWARSSDNIDDLDCTVDWNLDWFMQYHEDRYASRCAKWSQEYHNRST